MKGIDKKFEQFAECLESAAGAGGEIPRFGDLCVKIGVEEKHFDKYLHSHFGLGGREIVMSYRTATPAGFL